MTVGARGGAPGTAGVLSSAVTDPVTIVCWLVYVMTTSLRPDASMSIGKSAMSLPLTMADRIVHPGRFVAFRMYCPGTSWAVRNAPLSSIADPGADTVSLAPVVPGSARGVTKI